MTAVGTIVITRLSNGKLWLQRANDPEGMECTAEDEAALAALLEQFFNERF